jgi:hypothetical protein
MKLDPEDTHDVAFAQTVPVCDYSFKAIVQVGVKPAEELLGTRNIVVRPGAGGWRLSPQRPTQCHQREYTLTASTHGN